MKSTKKCLFFLSLIASGSTFTASAQVPIKLSSKYLQREITAPAVIKTELATQRQLIASKKLSFVVGYTKVSGKSIALISGEKEVSATDASKLKAVVANKRISALGAEIVKINLNKCIASKKSFDAREVGYVSPVKDQRCGNCWSYSAVSSYEASYKRVNGSFIDASEQQVVSCSNGGDCEGGYTYKVFEWMVNNNKNLVTDASLPDGGTNGNCPGQPQVNNYYATDWGIVDPSNDINKIASVADIKSALCKYGPISASVYVTTLFQNYAGGVFSEFNSSYENPSSNHAINIVGWDDDKQAWLIKNSWGTDWGENGFMWIKYNSNNIGRRACWVIAKKKPLVMTPVKDVQIMKPARKFETIQQKKAAN